MKSIQELVFQDRKTLQRLIEPTKKARKALKKLGINIDKHCVIECEECKRYLIFKTFNQQIINKELAKLGWNVKYNGKENKMYTYYCSVCTEKEINVKERIILQTKT